MAGMWNVDPDPHPGVLKTKKMKTKLLFEAIDLYLEDLQDVTRMLATMAVTQVSVERLFSALNCLKATCATS